MRTLFLALALATPLAAQEPLATDRPDFVESAQTVGHRTFQFETSAATDWQGTERMVATPTLLRYGVGPHLELRFETEGFLRATADGVPSESGLADAALGLKWHALDGEGSRPAVAFLLHGDLPSGSELFRGHGVRPSLRGVAEWELPGEFTMGVMPGIAYAPNGGAAEWSALFGFTVGHPISERLRGFIEYAAEELPLSTEAGAVSFFEFGLAWVVTPDVQIDLSGGVGLTERAPDGAVAIGFSRRFR